MMGRLLGFALFGLGATVGTEVVRTLAGGEQLDPREAVKTGVRLWNTLTQAAADAQTEFDAFQAQVKADSELARRHAGRPDEPRKIKVTVA